MAIISLNNRTEFEKKSKNENQFNQTFLQKPHKVQKNKKETPLTPVPSPQKKNCGKKLANQKN